MVVLLKEPSQRKERMQFNYKTDSSFPSTRVFYLSSSELACKRSPIVLLSVLLSAQRVNFVFQLISQVYGIAHRLRVKS